MITALNAAPGRLDPPEQQFVDNVRQYGWHCTTVAADEIGPGFAYTTGTWVTLGVPELIVFSLDDRAHDVLTVIYTDLEQGRRFETGTPVSDVLNGYDVFLMPVALSHYPHFLGWSEWFYGPTDFPCLQLVWPDRNGFFPWQAEAAHAYRDLQPDLSEQGWASSVRQ